VLASDVKHAWVVPYVGVIVFEIGLFGSFGPCLPMLTLSSCTIFNAVQSREMLSTRPNTEIKVIGHTLDRWSGITPFLSLDRPADARVWLGVIYFAFMFLLGILNIGLAVQISVSIRSSQQ
jgi:hypothetical protein